MLKFQVLPHPKIPWLSTLIPFHVVSPGFASMFVLKSERYTSEKTLLIFALKFKDLSFASPNLSL